MYKSFLLLIILLSSNFAFSQSHKDKENRPVAQWEDMILTDGYKLQDVKKAFYSKWDNHDYVKDDGYKIFKRWEYWMEYFVDSTGVFDKDAIEKEYLAYKNRFKSGFYRESNGNWEQLGPFGFISSYGIGRVNVIAYDPNDSDVLWLGAPAGGLWKSTNRGESWTFYSQDFRMMGVSDIAINPVNTMEMYVATGDRDAGDTYTYGLMKSNNGGLSWTKTSLPNVSKITRVLINPSNPQNLVVATTIGVFKSNDGGETWSKTLTGKYIKHMEHKPGDFNTIYATDYSYSNGNSKFYKSNNGGQSFSAASIDGMSSDVSRVAIAVTESDPEKVFLLAGINNSGWDSNDFEGLYRSADSGNSFQKINVLSVPELGSQSWYDWTFAVSPDNDQEIFAGGVNFYKSSDGGLNWQRMSNWSNPNNNDHFHVDHHYLGFQPGTNYLFAGNDGGAYYSENKGLYWSSLNENLSITQYYKISGSYDNPEMLIGGSQDNGTHMNRSSGWSRVMGGDGMDCLIDYSNSNNVFASYQQGYLRKSTNKGNNFKDMLTPDRTNEAGAWVTPFVMDPNNPNIMYAGFESVWKSVDKGDNWDNVSGSLNNGATVRGLAVAPSNSNFVYAFYLNKIFKSEDQGASWSEINKPNGNTIRDLAVSPSDPDKIWLAVNNDVFFSDNGGNSWTNIDGTLPNVPMTSIIVQNNSLQSVYLGTYIGVFYTDNTMSDWIPFNNGLPEVRIGELEIDEQFGKLRVGTFGRGMWQSPLYDFDEGKPLCTSLISPESGSRIMTSEINLVWRKVNNIDGYKLVIGSEEGSNDILDTTDVVGVNSFTWSNNGYEGKAYVQILPFNENGIAANCYTSVLYVGCYFEDKDVLLSLYEKLDGSHWKNKWDTTDCDISQWFGIETNEEGRVISLDLDGVDDNSNTFFAGGNKLKGQLDSIIGQLPYLESLYLAYNDMSGPIPENIKNLSKLEYLDLSNNNFSGEFPEGLTQLENLRYLNLGSNNFSGEIKASFGKWKKMNQLVLSNNDFTGKLPATLGNLTSAWNIDLSFNSFSGSLPFQLWFLKSLFSLNLSHNQLSGKLSKQVVGSTNLIYLYLDHNKLSNSIPEALGDKEWVTLNMSYNELEGCFPDKLKNLCGSDINFIGNTKLPANGDFNKFCSSDFGMCSKLPVCSAGLDFEGGKTDSLPYDIDIKWKKVDNAAGYNLKVGTTSNGDDILGLFDVGNNTSFDVGEMPKNSTIYVNIYPYNKYGKPSNCSEFTFTTSDSTLGIDKSLDIGNSIKVYPVPASDFITMKKIKSGVNNVNYELIDMSGRKSIKGNWDSAKQVHIINVSSLKNGIYFIKLNINGEEFYSKILKQ